MIGNLRAVWGGLLEASRSAQRSKQSQGALKFSHVLCGNVFVCCRKLIYILEVFICMTWQRHCFCRATRPHWTTTPVQADGCQLPDRLPEFKEKMPVWTPGTEVGLSDPDSPTSSCRRVGDYVGPCVSSKVLEGFWTSIGQTDVS